MNGKTRGKAEWQSQARRKRQDERRRIRSMKTSKEHCDFCDGSSVPLLLFHDDRRQEMLRRLGDGAGEEPDDSLQLRNDGRMEARDRRRARIEGVGLTVLVICDVVLVGQVPDVKHSGVVLGIGLRRERLTVAAVVVVVANARIIDGYGGEEVRVVGTRNCMGHCDEVVRRRYNEAF